MSGTLDLLDSLAIAQGEAERQLRVASTQALAARVAASSAEREEAERSLADTQGELETAERDLDAARIERDHLRHADVPMNTY